MIVEINFLEKKNKKKFAPYLLIFFALLFIGTSISIVMVQSMLLSDSIASKNNQITQLEALISDNQAEFSDYQGLIDLEEKYTQLKESSNPIIPLYQAVLGLFPSPKQLNSYTQVERKSVIVNGSFQNFKAVGEFVSKLTTIPYIQDVTITSVNQTDKGYNATLTIYLHEDLVKKELNTNG
jgi:cell division protein FtsL